MSRSNPNTGTSNPSTRWHEWAGDKGIIKYYDKTAQQNVEVKLPFTFILLDETATVKGWHDASDSGIYANEVKDTRQDVLVVRAFKGGEIASGHYAAIRDRIGAMGGHFVANLYIAYRNGDDFAIGALQFKGAALKTWMEFRKQAKRDVYEQAITISKATKGKKGSITYFTPEFTSTKVSDASNAKAIELDKELQAYLTAYFARTKDSAAAASKEDLAKADAEFAGGYSDDTREDRIAEQERAARETAGPPLNAGSPSLDPEDAIPFAPRGKRSHWE